MTLLLCSFSVLKLEMPACSRDSIVDFRLLQECHSVAMGVPYDRRAYLLIEEFPGFLKPKFAQHLHSSLFVSFSRKAV